jgi:hypothetical protein
MATCGIEVVETLENLKSGFDAESRACRRKQPLPLAYHGSEKGN